MNLTIEDLKSRIQHDREATQRLLPTREQEEARNAVCTWVLAQCHEQYTTEPSTAKFEVTFKVNIAPKHTGTHLDLETTHSTSILNQYPIIAVLSFRILVVSH